MNYLAHAWLSFGQPEILLGNMISDFIKGKKQFDFKEEIHKGIVLHRRIDTFTDEHYATRQAKEYFRPVVGLYSGAFVDIAYDHFLANDRNEFATEDSLLDFSLFVYEKLDELRESHPSRFARLFPYMKKENWLYNYRTLWGIEKSFGGLMYRAKYLEHNSVVFEIFQKHLAQLRTCYQSFFPAVKTFAYSQLVALNAGD